MSYLCAAIFRIKLMQQRISAPKCHCLVCLLIWLTMWGHSLQAEPVAFDRFYEQYGERPLKDLKKLGNQLLNQENADSAMMFYRLVTGHDVTKLSQQEREIVAGTYVNCGYICSFFYNDFSQAYMNYQKAEDIAVEYGLTTILPYIYLNKGTVYANYGENQKVINLYERAFYCSIEAQQWDITLTAFTNIMQLLDCVEQRDTLIAVIETFSRQPFPSETEMLEYSRCIERASRHVLASEWDEAIIDAQEAEHHIDLQLQPERYAISCNQLLAQLYFHKQDYRMAIHYYTKVLDEAQRQSAYDCMNDGLDGLLRTYEAMGDSQQAQRFRIQKVELRDSLFTSRSYAMICDIETAYEVNKIGAKVEQLEREKRQQLMLTTGIGISAVVFLILIVLIVLKNRSLNEQNHLLYEKNEQLMRLQQEAAQVKGNPNGTGPLKTDDKKNELLERIEQVMKDVEIFSRADFSLAMLAELTDSKERYVSQVINEEIGKNFSAWLGELRVMEACRRIKDQRQYGQLTFEGIGLSLGFKSRSNFTSVFKKVTGLTPSEYQKIAMQE